MISWMSRVWGMVLGFRASLFPHLPILPAKEQQRGSISHHLILHFRDENRMIARLLGRLQPALQISQRTVQHWRSMARAIKPRPGFVLRVFMGALRTGIVVRDYPLLRGEHVDAEALFGVQVRMGTSHGFHADQHQHVIERNRREGIGSHAVHFAVEIHRDDGHPGGEAAHGLAEIGGIQSHARRDVASKVSLTRIRNVIAQTEAATSYPRTRATAYITTAGRCIIRGKVDATPITSCDRQAQSATLGEIRPGQAISRQAALRLIRCSDNDLPELLAAARAAKERFKPGVITYSRKVFIPLTNLCRDYCGYCTFRRDPSDPGAHTMTPEEVLEVARAGEKLGCTEALFSLGDKPELLFPEMRESLRHLGYKSTLHYLEAMCALVLRETSLLPHPNPGLLSAEWVARLAAVSPSMGLMLETTNASLLAPGAAHDNAPDKLPSKRLKTIEDAGKRSVPFTTGLLIGTGESP